MSEYGREGASGEAPQRVRLRLYVAGRSRNGTAALRSVTRYCERWLHGRYELRVIDVLKEPAAAGGDDVVATPTLLRISPTPAVRIFGALLNDAELALVIPVAPKDADTVAARRPARSSVPHERA